jgi:hypothetical protein
MLRSPSKRCGIVEVERHFLSSVSGPTFAAWMPAGSMVVG